MWKLQTLGTPSAVLFTTFKKLARGCLVGGARWPNNDRSAYQGVMIETLEVNALCDSGASVSFVDHAFFKKSFPTVSVSSCDHSFVSISGSRFCCVGLVQLNVSVFKRTVCHTFFLIHSPVAVVLGLDVLCALHVSIVCSPDKVFVETNMDPVSSVTVDEPASSKTVDYTVCPDVEFLNLFQLPTGVSLEVSNQLKDLLLEYKDVFSCSKYDIGCTSLGYHDICTGNANPVFHRPYRMAHSHKKIATDLIEDMLKNGIIEEAQSAWSSPFILVDKSDGTKRFAVDYRSLNDVTVKDRLPMPNVDELLDGLSSFKYFSLLDLTSGFWQVPLTENAKPKTAFGSNNSQYQFKVMPFGLTNAPATFQRIIQKAVHDLPTTPFIDDLIVPTIDVVEQLLLLRNVFERLRSARFKLKPAKCVFMVKKIKYLGFVVEDGKLFPDPEKLRAVKEFPVPRSTKDLQRFLGLCNFFSRFINDFATLASPLTCIQNTPAKAFSSVWKEKLDKHVNTFQLLKDALISPLVLVLPDFNQSFCLDVDASEVAVSGVLYQKGGAVSFFSQKLQPAQKNYSTTDKEFLALYSSVMRFRAYLLGPRFTVYSDHKPLSSLVFGKAHNARQTRWQLALQEFDFSIHYKPGLLNTAADALSRIEIDVPVCATVSFVQSVTDMIRIEQGNCREILHCVEAMKKGEPISFIGNIAESIRKCCELSVGTFSVCDNFLYHEDRLVISPNVVSEVVLRYHQCGHFSANNTQKRILERFWAPKLRSVIMKVVSSCECRLLKSYGHNPQPSKFPVCEPFEVLSLDIVSLPFDRGYSHILTMIDMRTKIMVAAPLPSMRAEDVARAFLQRWLYVYGPPAVLHSDQGGQFVGDVMSSLREKFNIAVSNSSVYHPKGNSVVERAHRTLKDRLRSKGGHWTECLPEAVYDCNRLTGAFYTVFRRTALPSCDWPNRSDFLSRRCGKAGPLAGDTVAIRDRSPRNTLAPRFSGRFRVSERRGNAVVLSDGRQVNLHDCVLVERNDGPAH